MPKGHEHDPLYSLSIRNIANLFREKGDHYYILTRHNVFLFFIYFFFLFTILLFKKPYYKKTQFTVIKHVVVMMNNFLNS